MKKFCNGKYTIKQLEAAIKKYGALATAARELGVDQSTMRSAIENWGVMPPLPPRGSHKINPQAKLDKEVEDFKKPVAAGEVGSALAQRERLQGKRFVFTSAQNNTYVNKKFLKSLLTYCEHTRATLYVSRYTYNKTGFQNNFKEKEGLWYDPAIATYVLDKPVVVFDGLVFCGELDILPTAQDPLSGFESYAGYNSAIIPHAKVAMRSLPRLKGELPRFLYTTGTVTQRNYIQRKAGQKAEFHHVYGALVVEVNAQGFWFVRQLIADGKGEFHDLEYKYTPAGYTKERVEAVNYGDIHIEKEDREVSEASWEAPDSILRTLNPRFQFVHDLTDFSARNHHEINNPYFIARKHFRSEDHVEEGLKKSSDFLDKISKFGKVVVVESNHHEAFQRWLCNAEGHRDPANAEFYHEANARVFRAIRENEKGFDIYEWALKKYNLLSAVQFLTTDESFTICSVASAKNSIECGMHGHLGIDGARGSSRSFRSLGRRVNVGHSHSANIVDGVYTAGVSGKLDMDYNRGPSSWSHSHIITYANGKRAIITIKNGKWRA